MPIQTDRNETRNLNEAPETFDLPTYCLSMSPLAKEYRRKAQVAEALAEAVKDQAAKEVYREVAERWRRLAEQAEANNW